MVADRIEREITIAAPPERVREALAGAEFPGAWLDTEGTDGSTDAVAAGGAETAHAEPPAVLAFRRPHRQHPQASDAGGGTTLVTFTLTAEPGNHTRLRVVESGFAALTLPPETLRAGFERQGHDWTHRLTLFAVRTERLVLRR
ncbi:polyketide cyclase [Kitasatospora sp. NPDC056327]|uniref:polyketide cyclase n=1 Tax=Kitasatospora sp. NPDC056327 TaxID=3345785 RepID=UPI0035E28DFF